MTITAVLRTAAIATALVGLVDPSWTIRRPAPVAVEINSAVPTDADDVRRRLARSLGDAVSFDSEAEPAALVVVGGVPRATVLPRAGVPVSTVSLARPAAPNARIVAADEPDPGRVGWSASFHAVIEATGLAGTSSSIVLEERGVELAHLEHRWTSESERFAATLRYTPPASATSTVTLRVLPADGETTVSDNAADLRFVASGRRLSVLVHESRPSWNATFLRRVLEQDPSFAVSAFVQASKGLDVRAGTPPAALTSKALTAFEAVIIGSPEDLRPSEVEALRMFARRRGGAVVLVPDRRPSGSYLDLIPSPQFDEILVENAIELRSILGVSLRASEMAVHRAGVSGGQVLATLEGQGGQEKAARAVVLEWPDGAGRVLFSGAMDAWRFRAASDDGFGRFWRARVAEGAMAAPARVEVNVAPGAPRPGEAVTIRARLRQTEFEQAAPGHTQLPAVRARLVGADGAVHTVRLWPMAEQGVFEGRFEAPAAGRYDLEVTTATGATVDEVINVVAEARHPSAAVENSERAGRVVASATGGVAVGSTDLAPLERHLRSLSSGDAERTVRPARSVLLVLVFAGLLSAEWTIRRRRGRA